MKKHEIAGGLEKLSDAMREIAHHMGRIPDDPWPQHAEELHGTAKICLEWVEEIRRDNRDCDGY